MNKKTKFLFAAVSLCLTAACSRDMQTMVPREKSVNEQQEEIDKLVESTLDSVDYYRNLPPDFTLSYVRDLQENMVMGHLGSPIHFLNDAGGEHVFLSFSPIPVELKVVDGKSVKVLSAAFPDDFPMTLENVQQNGASVTFSLAIAGEEKMDFVLSSGNFLTDSIESGGILMVHPGFWPVLKWVAEHVILPIGAGLAVEVMSGGNSRSGGSNNSNNPALWCIEAHVKMQAECLKTPGNSFSEGHGPDGNCPRGCWTRCISPQSPQ